MKRLFTNTLLASLVLLVMQSCSINTEILFHKDASVSVQYSIDMKELINLSNSTKAKEPMQIKRGELTSLLTENWKSYHDLAKEINGTETPITTSNVDRKVLVKGVFDDKKELTGFAMKFGNLTKQELEELSKKEQLTSEAIREIKWEPSDWDGKKVEIDTKWLNEYLELLEESKDIDKKSMNEILSKTDFVKYNSVLKFENKIKKIIGNHPFFTKVDDHTVKISFELTEKEIPKSKKKASNSIIIITH